MKKITNPFAEPYGKIYHCFGCSPHNDHGLKLQFWDNEGEVICKWKPDQDFEGYLGVVHGGIIATIFDEIASWFIYTQHKTAGVTSEMKIKYLKPVRIAKGAITVCARFLRKRKQIVTVSCILTDADSVQCATAEVSYFLFPADIAVSRYNYPGYNAFYT